METNFKKKSRRKEEEIRKTIKFFKKNLRDEKSHYILDEIWFLDVSWCIWKKDWKVVSDFEIYPLNNVSLPRYFWRCGLKKTAIELQNNQDQELFRISENVIEGVFLV